MSGRRAGKAKPFCPEPGVYEDVAMKKYHTWDAASKSRLWAMRQSPAHAKVIIDVSTSGEDDDPTPGQVFGRAFHAALLEPDVFKAQYATADQCIAHTEKGSRCQKKGAFPLTNGKSICGIHFKKALAEDRSLVLDENVEVLSKKVHAACLTIRERVIAKARASGLVSGPGRAELSIVWEDPETGIMCKGRIDRHTVVKYKVAAVVKSIPTIVDVKTTVDASDYAFERTIFRYGYHGQGAMYLDGAQEVDLPAEQYVIMAVEKKEPYESSVFRLNEAAIDAGRDLLRSLLLRYAWCKKKGIWPGYPDRVREIALPDWAWKATDDIILELEERWKATV